MKAAIIIPPKDFSDESLKDSVLMLEKWNVKTDITSYSKSDCIGRHGAVIKLNMNTAKVHSDDYDILILLNGPGVDSYRLYEFRPLYDLIRGFLSKGKVVAGIGNGMKVIARTNLINGVKIAIPPDKETADTLILYHGIITRNNVMSDKNIVTAKDSENTIEFINAILETAKIK
jgi:putative intracellular protease/amidase